ncbi:MAG: cytosine methyltransferase [Planctomycetota bacterium]|nr:MAG: cytosine methyltransferase [Planctomycetota bacterium]
MIDDSIKHNSHSLKYLRIKLRKTLTPAEAKLWTYIQGKQLDGRKFRRQHSVGRYILDFYCPSEKLAIELDGNGHLFPSGYEKDQKRDQHLSEQGITVLRFENKLVFENSDMVLRDIKKYFKRTNDK